MEINKSIIERKCYCGKIVNKEERYYQSQYDTYLCVKCYNRIIEQKDIEHKSGKEKFDPKYIGVELVINKLN